MTVALLACLIASLALLWQYRTQARLLAAQLDGAHERISAQAGVLARSAEANRPPVEARSPKWPAVRDAQLRRKGWCEACGRRERLAVHHVKPFHFFPELELEPDNLMTLCEHPTLNCHLWVGHGGNWKWWNPYVRADAYELFKIVQHAEASKDVS